MDQSLPPDVLRAMCRENSCFFTGHRFIADDQVEPLCQLLLRCILDRYAEGVRYFVNGGALGFDLLSARTVALLKREHTPDIKLILALPCRDQTARWSGVHGAADFLRQYHEVKGQADAVLYIRDFYEDGCMRERNQYMADRCGRCIAYWNGSTRGGTAQTVRMAQKRGIPLWNLYPTAQESF